jgi:hypothetical protein
VPLQNRVTPLGELIADPARGLVYGNRGCLHDETGRIRRSFNGKRWIACRLEFKGWHRNPLMQPGRFTELFFLDEVTAFAAGHRPCALCRREDYSRFVEIWRELHADQAGADAIDAQLHRERLGPDGRTRRFHEAPIAALPDGAFILRQGRPCVIFGKQLAPWTAAGYEEPLSAPPDDSTVRVVTPESLVRVLLKGWRGLVPLTHPSLGTARRADGGDQRSKR